MWPLLAFLKRRNRRRNRGREEEIPEGPTFDFPMITMFRASSRESQHGGISNDNTNYNTTAGTTTLPLLYTLARSWAWTAVAFRCQTHPHEVSTEVVDHRGDNPLHWTAFGNPPMEVVQALLQVCPALAKQPNHQGLYPLHGMSIFSSHSDVELSTHSISLTSFFSPHTIQLLPHTVHPQLSFKSLLTRIQLLQVYRIGWDRIQFI
jgi:hypothetical protein